MAKRVAEIRDDQVQQLYTAVGALVSPEQAGELEQLGLTADGARLSEVERLRRPPTDNTPTELTRQAERLGELRAFALAEVDVSQIPEPAVTPGSLRARVESVHDSRAEPGAENGHAGGHGAGADPDWR
ncbi:hypothetical protein [Saccharopolyspora griseoalba]|uniref:Uncharacterized protein n=1 Tax=Saccharopolyspora griseoalba TaxID=1431848 RepID=A0ABW2LKK1_9PSEU